MNGTMQEYNEAVRKLYADREALKDRADKEYDVALWQLNERFFGTGSWGVNSEFE